MIKNYISTRQFMEISGVGHYHGYNDELVFQKTGIFPCSGTPSEEECAGVDPMVKRIWELEYEIEYLKDLIFHVDNGKHSWDDNGFCTYCGWDGNA